MTKRNQGLFSKGRSPWDLVLPVLAASWVAAPLIAAACASPTPNKGVQIIETLAPALNLALTAPAHHLRGWAKHLGSPGDPLAVAGVERAAELAPGDALFTESSLYLQVPISTGPPEDVTVTPTATPELAPGAGPVPGGDRRVMEAGSHGPPSGRMFGL